MAKSLESETTTNGDEKSTASKRKFMISTKASWALSLALGGDEKVDEIRSPIGDAKAIKNDTELEGMRKCHIRDGAALTKYFAWLEEELVTKGTKLDEVQAADKLEEFRSYVHHSPQAPKAHSPTLNRCTKSSPKTSTLTPLSHPSQNRHFIGLSFDTISSTGANAAIIHYKPERHACATIDPHAIYLCDSGAQYLDGTTDTTRTLHFGQPSALERKAYTLVLKGVIALDRAVFPKGTNGLALDTLARQFLWEEGLDYRHGTGHGVGSYLVGAFFFFLHWRFLLEWNGADGFG